MSPAGDDAFSRLLYPMLRSRETAPAELVDELAAAPLEKAAETSRLRDRLRGDAGRLATCAERIADRIGADGRLLACGNGGSATTAADLVADLLEPTASQPPVPALSLTADVAVITALANDIGVADVFARQLMALGRAEDILMVISTSGGSENLLRALATARRAGMMTVAVTGNGGGRIAQESACDHLFDVPSPSVHRIQEVQTTICHLLVELIRHHQEVRACA